MPLFKTLSQREPGLLHLPFKVSLLPTLLPRQRTAKLWAAENKEKKKLLNCLRTIYVNSLPSWEVNSTQTRLELQGDGVHAVIGQTRTSPGFKLGSVRVWNEKSGRNSDLETAENLSVVEKSIVFLNNERNLI